MKTFAVKEKRSAPVIRRSQPSRFGRHGPEVKAQQAEIRRILRGPRVQAKLTIGAPEDRYEREADRIADEVMRMPEPCVQRTGGCPECEEDRDEFVQSKPLADQITPLVQRQIEPEEEEEEEPIQAKPADGGLLQRQEEEPEEEEEELLQSKSNQTKQMRHVGSCLESQIDSLRSSGQPLLPSTRAFFEPRFGQNFSNVRIHTDSKAGEMAKAVNAQAFTTGSNIAFASGKYDPETSSGKRDFQQRWVAEPEP